MFSSTTGRVHRPPLDGIAPVNPQCVTHVLTTLLTRRRPYSTSIRQICRGCCRVSTWLGEGVWDHRPGCATEGATEPQRREPRPRAARSRRTAWGSVTGPRIRRAPPQCGQTRISIANTRRKSGAHDSRPGTDGRSVLDAGGGSASFEAAPGTIAARHPGPATLDGQTSCNRLYR